VTCNRLICIIITAYTHYLVTLLMSITVSITCIVLSTGWTNLCRRMKNWTHSNMRNSLDR